MNLATRVFICAALTAGATLVAAPAALAHDDAEAVVSVETDDDDGLDIEIVLDLDLGE